MLAWFSVILASMTMAGISLLARWGTGRGGRASWIVTILYLFGAGPCTAVWWWAAGGRFNGSALALGALAGSMALAGTILALLAMRHGKVGPTSLFLYMAAAGPILLGQAMGWDAALTAGKVAGLALAVASMALCTLGKNGGGSGAAGQAGGAPAGRSSLGVWLALALAGFVVNAVNQSCQKALSGFGLKEYTSLFNVGYFALGGMFGVAGSVLMDRLSSPRAPTANAPGCSNQAVPVPARPQWRLELLVGCAGGALCIPQMYAILYAAGHLPGAVAFSTMSVLPLALVTVGAWAAFGERLTGREWAGLAMACAALVLINS